MNLRRLEAVVVIAAVSLALPGAARGSVPEEPIGRSCGYRFEGVESYTEQPYPEYPILYYVAQLDGGPIVGNGTLKCTIQAVSGIHGTAANDAASATASDGGTGVTILQPTTVRFSAPLFSNIFLCTEFTPASGSPRYWHVPGSRWTTDPGAACEVMAFGTVVVPGDVTVALPPPVDDAEGKAVVLTQEVYRAYYSLIDEVYRAYYNIKDDRECAVFRALQPGVAPYIEVKPDGDVYIGGVYFWDCPPHSG